MSNILSISRTAPADEHIETARTCLMNGGLVIMPTETVYGVACDPAIPGALEALYRVKGRADDKPIARLAANFRQVAAEATHWTDALQAIAETYWPGPLTIVLQTEEGFTGYRVPDHLIPIKVAQACGRTLALTSANRSGAANPATAQEAADQLNVDLILDAGAASDEAIPSTVIKISGDTIECLREGALAFSVVQDLFLKHVSA